MTAKDIYKKILLFFDSCNKVYCYGNGHYGKAMIAFLDDSGRRVDGVIVSHVNEPQEGVVSAAEITGKLTIDDGIIFSMSEKNRRDIDTRYFAKITKCLFLPDWQLDEVEKNEYYRIVGNMPNVGFGRYLLRNMAISFCGLIRKKTIKNKKLEKWHFIPKCQKPYCNEIVDYILEKTPKMKGVTIAELGCGLCDIIGDKRLNNYCCYGLDIDSEVIEEASLHYNNIKLSCGTFDNVEDLGDLTFLITVNFIHCIPAVKLKEMLKTIILQNKLEYYIADEVTGNYQNKYLLEDVLPANYVLDKVIGIHPSDGGVRIIKAFKRKET